MYVWCRRMIWYDTTYNYNLQHGCLGAEICVFRIALSCAMKNYAYRPVRSWKQKCTARAVEKKSSTSHLPSWKKLCTVRSRREKLWAPSRPAEQKYIYRPVPSWQFLFTVPSRRDNFYLPSRPVMTIFIYRPVPSWNKKVIVLYRPVPSRKFIPTVPSRPIQATIVCIFLRSRLVPFSYFSPNMSKQYRPVYHRAWKALIFPPI